MAWKKKLTWIAAAAAGIALLTFAFWYGGDSGGLHGWSVIQTQNEMPHIAEQEKEPAPSSVSGTEMHCTVSVSCASVLEHMDWLDPGKKTLIPADGWILETTEAAFSEGETVFDVLLRVCREKKIHMEFAETPLYQSAYIEGIHNLYEFDCGELSGWMYSVNGQFPNYGCSRYVLSDGDRVCWVYSCELGMDVGGGFAGEE